ncbi:MAG: CinA family nicotinamide mononucleotide deamidase-related protein [Holophagales bacterium]|nr:MAG: CinA family nicotinamide mononucleotide deamidase-related protein [Holophagales bacterium]
MRAAILAVGSELLGADRLDTNSLTLAALLAEFGVPVERKSVVGDDVRAIAEEVSRLVVRHELLLVCGGLGPTADDVTREGVAEALGVELVRSPEVEAAIAARFASFGRTMPPANRKQADLLAGGDALVNPRGTAPGQRTASGSCTLFLFPGVPYELEGLAADHLVPWLTQRRPRQGSEVRTLRVACMPESEVDQRLLPLYASHGRERVTLLCSPGEVRVRLASNAPPAVRTGELDRAEREARALLGEAVFAADDRTTLEAVVAERLNTMGSTLAVAESCTGGLLCERLTRIPGASGFLMGGVVAYDNGFKRDLLGVPEAMFVAHGAVSEPVARQMADAIRALAGTTYGLAITGVAGPGGGTEEKPVGTVHLALDGMDPEPFVEHRCVRLPGDRERVRWQATQLALEMLRRRLLRREGER